MSELAVSSWNSQPRGLIRNSGASSRDRCGSISELWLPICSFQPSRAATRNTAAMSQRSRHSSASVSLEVREWTTATKAIYPHASE